MKKKKIIFGILIICICIGGGFGMNAIRNHLQKQDDEALMKKVAPEIEEFYQWNYIGVKNTKPVSVSVNPGTGERVVNYLVTLNNGETTEYQAYDVDTKISVVALTRQGNPSVTFKSPETGTDIMGSDSYLLSVQDIEALKRLGYTKKISGKEIVNYRKKRGELEHYGNE